MSKEKEMVGQAKQAVLDFMGHAKIQAHLASMETKDAWGEFSKQLKLIVDDFDKFVAKLEQEKDESRLQGHLALMAAKDRWENLTEHLDDLAHSFSQKTKPTVDEAKLQAHLAKMDAGDFFHDLQEKHRSNYGAAKEHIRNDWYSFLSHFGESFIAFTNKFPLK